MKNKMKACLGKDYSSSHLRNFCLYWLKGMACKPVWEHTEEGHAAYDAWRKENDLDCLYCDGDLRADTLMSAWTPISWVANCLNRENGKEFVKTESDIRLLAEEGDTFLPPENELVRLLDRFLELAEKPCNYMLLPDRNMNSDRYCFRRSAKFKMLYDEVPATLWHIFEKETLGMYFLDATGEVDEEAVTAWVLREKLEMGFRKGIIKQSEVIPLTKSLNPRDGKRLKEEGEIREALNYMIRFLRQRDRAMKMNKATDKAVKQLNRVFEVWGPYGGMIKTDNPCWWTLCSEIYDETETVRTMSIYMSGGEAFDYVMDPWFFLTAKIDNGKIVDVTIDRFREWNGFGYDYVDERGRRHGIGVSLDPDGLRKLFSEFMNSVCDLGPYLTDPKAVYRSDANGEMKKIRRKRK
jgi:hypothetical protein